MAIVISQQYETVFLCQIWTFPRNTSLNLQFKRFHFTMVAYPFPSDTKRFELEDQYEKDDQYASGACNAAEPPAQETRTATQEK